MQPRQLPHKINVNTNQYHNSSPIMGQKYFKFQNICLSWASRNTSFTWDKHYFFLLLSYCQSFPVWKVHQKLMAKKLYLVKQSHTLTTEFRVKKKKSSFLDYVRNALVDIITYYAVVDHKHATFDNNKTGPLITEEANHFIPSMQYSVTMKQGHKNTTYD